MMALLTYNGSIYDLQAVSQQEAEATEQPEAEPVSPAAPAAELEPAGKQVVLFYGVLSKGNV